MIYENEKPVRILHILYSMDMGGAENFLMNVYRNIDKSKIQFDFLVHKSGLFDDEIKKNGGKIYYLDGYITEIGPRKYRKLLIEFIKTHQEYKIVHSHVDMTSGFIIPLFKKYNDCFCISHSHCAKNLNNILIRIYKNYLKFKLNHYTDYRIACSIEAGKWLYGNHKYEVLNNPVDFDKFKFNNEQRKTLREKFNIGENEIVIGHVGRFVKVKNHEYLLKLFEIYSKQKKSKLVLIGDGILKTQIMEFAKKYNIDNNVIILSNIYDIYNYYNIFDMFVFPSLYEGLGIVLLEAQANGLHVITSENVPRNVDISNNVKFLNLNNFDQWLKEIDNIDIQRDIDKLDVTNYKIETIVQKLEKIYNKGNDCNEKN